MAVTEMLQALEAEASARFERIRQRAEDEARALLKGAEERIRPLQEEAMAKVHPALVAERARRLTRARFAVRKEVTLAKEALIDEVFRQAKAKLDRVRQLPVYPAAFRALVREALEGVRGKIKVIVDARDVTLTTQVLKELGVDAEVEPAAVTAGGLRLEVDGGRVIIDNTFEARLAKAEKFLRPEVNQTLFGR
ncbi:MAG: V-type ATP synthase subunit E [Bacillota bacterium]|nr:V-type ATP synthase subunit E [Bacillota bacterium]